MLTAAEQEQFIRDGFVTLRGVFDEEAAGQLVALVWAELGEDPDAPSAAFRARPQLEQVIEEGPIDALLCDALVRAVDALAGEGRWWTRRGFGWTTVRFPARQESAWRPPDSGWHVDGIHFHHRLDSPEQALVGIEMLTPAPAGGGGTVVKRGSHRAIARALHEAGEAGLSYPELRAQSEALDGHEPVEIAGDTGDVLLMHPHLVHARGMNVRSRPRLASNRCFAFHEPMRLRRPDGDHSLVERAIRVAIGLE